MNYLTDVVHGKQNPALVIGEIGLVRSLGEADIPVIVGSEIKNNPVFHTRYASRKIVFSSYDSEEFIDELCELGKNINPKPVIFSDDDRAILNISNNRNRLKDYFLFLYPGKERVAGILDKQRFTELSIIYQLPCPESFQVSTLSDFVQTLAFISYPCIIKPTQRHFWWGDEFFDKVGEYKKAFKCETSEELRALYHKIAEINPSVVIQEYVAGEDNQHYSANLFVNEAGQLKGYYIAQKLRIYPIKAGTGTYVVTADNRDVARISEEIIRKLDLKGLINIQFKQDSRTGEHKLMEIHARNSLWSLLGNKAGANLAVLYYEYLVGMEDNKETVIARPDVKYINLSKDIRAFLGNRAEGRITFSEWLTSLKGDRVFASLSLRDPLPVLYQLLQIFRKRVKIFSHVKSNNESKGKEEKYVIS